MTRALCLYGIVHGTKRKWNDGTVFMTTGVGPRHYPQSNKYQKRKRGKNTTQVDGQTCYYHYQFRYYHFSLIDF